MGCFAIVYRGTHIHQEHITYWSVCREYKITNRSKTGKCDTKEAKKTNLRVAGIKPKKRIICLYILIPPPQFSFAVYDHQFNYKYEIASNDSLQWFIVNVEEELQFCSYKFYKGPLKLVFHFLIRIFHNVTRRNCLLDLA